MGKNLRQWASGIGVALLLAATIRAPIARAEETRGDTPWLGTYLQALTPELREGLDYRGEGVLVSGVVDDSPADRAGIRKGDVITRADSRIVTSPEQLTRLIRSSRTGETLALQINRHGSRETFSVRLAARPANDDFDMRVAPPIPPTPPDVERHDDGDDDDNGNAPDADDDDHGKPDGDDHGKAPDADDHDDHGHADMDHGFTFEFPREGMSMLHMGRGRLGIRIESMNSDLGDYFGAPSGKGVLVMEVLKDTPAERAGLHAGDVITHVGDREVSDADDLVNALRTREGKVSLTVVRHGTHRTVEADLGQADRRVMRLRSGEGMLGSRDRGRSLTGDDRDEMKREIQQLREELRNMRRELDGMKHD